MIALKLFALWLIVVTQPGATLRDLTIAQPIHQEGAWLCLYDACGARVGGVAYGGAILVLADDVLIERNTIRGGIIGIAAVGVQRVTIRENTLTNQSGWGIYLKDVDSALVEHNLIRDAIRSCPESPDGCESAGMLLLNVSHSTLRRNQIEYAGDCIYANGEGAPSHINAVEWNTCLAAPHNGIEWTFAHDVTMRGNTIRGDEQGRACLYPMWLDGSQVTLSGNETACIYSLDRAVRDARDSTAQPTEVVLQKGAR